MTAKEQPENRPEPLARDRLPMRVADLSPHRAHRFHLRPDAQAREALARALGISALRKLDFSGALRAEGRRDWRLEAALGATVEQPCVITGAPVRTRIDIAVTRLFRPPPPPEETAQEAPPDETEMPEDDSVEPLGAVIDPGAVMAEALALALPDYPRAPGAGLGERGFEVAPPGATPDAKPERENPFAALEALRKRGGEPEKGG